MERVVKQLKEKGYSNKQFDAWLSNPNVKKVHGEKNLKDAHDLWYGNVEDEVQPHPYDEMTKDQLDEYAINNFGIDLDKRFTKENMIEELNEKLKEQE